MVQINTTDLPATWGVQGQPRQGTGFNNTCKRFDVVGHTTHVIQGPTIFADGQLSSNLVYDNSTLQTRRIKVVFVSPNDWNNGYRYGNIRFDFNWSQLWQGKHAYWVETALYRIHAPRILVTSRDLALDPYWGPRVYDPTIYGGPWWEDPATGIHYFNNDHCLELMIEEDLLLSNATACKVVSHHPSFCCLHRNNPQACPDLGKDAKYAASRFLAGLAGSRVKSSLALLTYESGGTYHPNHTLLKCWACLVKDLQNLNVPMTGGLQSGQGPSLAVARSMLNAFSKGWNDDTAALVSQFPSIDELVSSCRAVVEEILGSIGPVTLPTSEIELDTAMDL